MCYMCYNAYDIWQGDIAHKKYTKPRLNILLCAILCYIAYDFWNQETSPYKKNTLNLYVIFFSDEKKKETTLVHLLATFIHFINAKHECCVQTIK